MKIITSWSTLIGLAKELGKARMSGDKKRLAIAEKEHDYYVKIVRKSDEMILD